MVMQMHQQTALDKMAGQEKRHQLWRDGERVYGVDEEMHAAVVLVAGGVLNEMAAYGISEREVRGVEVDNEASFGLRGHGRIVVSS